MSQNNNDNSGLAVGIAFIGAAAAVMLLVIFAAACFLAFVLTLIAFYAWNEPRVILGEVFDPQEARAFVYRGLAGAVLLPVFLLFCVILFNVYIIPEAWQWSMVAGYVGGSLGIEILIQQAREEQRQAASVEIIPPQMPQRPPPPRGLPSNRPPFEYASWDDEDAGR
jgi:hypothetical protein